MMFSEEETGELYPVTDKIYMSLKALDGVAFLLSEYNSKVSIDTEDLSYLITVVNNVLKVNLNLVINHFDAKFEADFPDTETESK